MTNKARIVRFIGLVSALSLGLAVGLGACAGDDEELGGFGESPTDTGIEDDAGGDDVDAGNDEQGAGECQQIDCTQGQECAEGTCFAATSIGYSCASPYELGTLSGDDAVSQLADPRGEPDVMRATCATPDANSPQAVFQFDVDQPVRANLEVESTFDESLAVLNQDIREGACIETDATVGCDTDPTGWFAEPGEDYYVIVEARSGSEIGEFELTVETEALECFPAGEWRCKGEEVAQCHGGNEEFYYTCPGGECIENDNMNDECAGNDCDQALVIDESQTLVADMTAYDTRFDIFEAGTNCVENTDDFSDFGNDLVLKFPDLATGETLEIAPPEEQRFVIGLLDECSVASPECVASNDQSARLEWEVEAPGDYFVVLRQDGVGDREYEIEVNIFE